MPPTGELAVYGNVTFEEARAAKARGLSTDEWYGQSRASRALDVALDRAEQRITQVLAPESET